MHTYSVYILTNKTNTVLYIGMTNNLERRIQEHKSRSIDGFTKKYCIDKLVYFEQTNEVLIAIAREKQLKKWSRAKKIQLIQKDNPQWLDLSENF